MNDPSGHFPSPPRRVPLSLAFVNVFNPHAQAGCLALGFASFLLWLIPLRAAAVMFILAAAAILAVGMVATYFAVRRGLRRNALLSDGTFAMGVLRSKRMTNRSRDRDNLFEIALDVTDADGLKQEVTTLVGARFAYSLEPGAVEPLLWDPGDPSRVYLFAEGRPRPRLDQNGELCGRPAAALFALPVPALLLGGNVFALLWRTGLVRIPMEMAAH